eukprot:2988133-Pyramimonas_sp.AAC.1
MGLESAPCILTTGFVWRASERDTIEGGEERVWGEGCASWSVLRSSWWPLGALSGCSGAS